MTAEKGVVAFDSVRLSFTAQAGVNWPTSVSRSWPLGLVVIDRIRWGVPGAIVGFPVHGPAVPVAFHAPERTVVYEAASTVDATVKPKRTAKATTPRLLHLRISIIVPRSSFLESPATVVYCIRRISATANCHRRVPLPFNKSRALQTRNLLRPENLKHRRTACFAQANSEPPLWQRPELQRLISDV